MKIGVFIKPDINRNFAKETFLKIADKYLDANEATIQERKDHIRLTDSVNIVELFVVGESPHMARGRRYHKIYYDPRYSIDFTYDAILPQACLPYDEPISRMEIAWQ